MKVYYNEFNPFAADWLRQLMAAEAIAQGDVDERSIEEVTPKDIKGYTQCHFFAGIGVWAYALDQAQWGKRPVWTGSCPCQPFSSPGHHKGIADRRHLWPAWYRLIRICRPDTIFGEQVAGKNGLAWFDAVSIDLEKSNYAVGAACTNACSFGAPHLRHRLYFAAALGYPNSGRQMEQKKGTRRQTRNANQKPQKLANADLQRLEGTEFYWPYSIGQFPSNDCLGYTLAARKEAFAKRWNPSAPWWFFDTVPNTEETEERPIRPGALPMAYGTPTSMDEVRGIGNALCAPQAQGFIEAFMET